MKRSIMDKIFSKESDDIEGNIDYLNEVLMFERGELMFEATSTNKNFINRLFLF